MSRGEREKKVLVLQDTAALSPRKREELLANREVKSFSLDPIERSV